MEEVKEKNYMQPQIEAKNIRTSILCGSKGEVNVGGGTNDPYDARIRPQEKNLKFIE